VIRNDIRVPAPDPWSKTQLAVRQSCGKILPKPAAGRLSAQTISPQVVSTPVHPLKRLFLGLEGSGHSPALEAHFGVTMSTVPSSGSSSCHFLDAKLSGPSPANGIPRTLFGNTASPRAPGTSCRRNGHKRVRGCSHALRCESRTLRGGSNTTCTRTRSPCLCGYSNPGLAKTTPWVDGRGIRPPTALDV
jgi:hypothetical protein